MSGRTPQPRTRFVRVPCGDPGTTVIRISGSLGPRAKPQLTRLTQECLRRNLPRLVFDLSEVDALGGGTARLLNEFAAERAGRGGKTAFRVTSRTVRGFLCADPNLPPPPLCASVDDAVEAVRDGQGARAAEVRTPSVAQPARAAVQPARAAVAPGTGREAQPVPPPVAPAAERPAPPAPRPERAQPVLEPNLASLLLPEEDDEGEPLLLASPETMDPFADEFGTPDGVASSEEVLDLDLTDAIEDHPVPDWGSAERQITPEELRDRLVTVLHERGVASRLFLFQRAADARYALVTRQGLDPERSFDVHGGLAGSVTGLRGPGFLVDLDIEALSPAEAELLGELNCEVAAPLVPGEAPEYLLFVSKELPGEEYSLEELQEMEGVLHAAGRGLVRRVDAPAVDPPPVTAAPAPPAVPAAAPAPARAPVTERPTALVASPELPDVPEALEVQAPGSEFVVAEPERPAPIRVGDSPDLVASRRQGSAEATRALRRSLAQMRDIISLSQDFDAAFGTSKLLEVLVLSVVSVARVETVFYFSAREGDYRLTHQRGMSPDAVQSLRLRGDSTLVQRALASARGVCIADEARITEEERIWARQHGLRWAVPFRFKDEMLGLLLLGESAGEAPPDLDMLALLLGQAALAFDRGRLYETLQDRTLGVVRGLITLIEARNGFDCGSTEQVVRYTQALARELQFPADGLRDLVYGAVLRDVGMLKVSESLLRSPADLSGDQWESIRRHPQEGASIMRQMRFNPLAVDVVLHHHEAYNGEGYPLGLRGRTIPLGARIVAVAESYVKMTMDRPYRKALGKAEALESLAENWGLRYDPLVVDALVRVVNRELSIGLKGDRDLARDLFGV